MGTTPLANAQLQAFNGMIDVQMGQDGKCQMQLLSGRPEVRIPLGAPKPPKIGTFRGFFYSVVLRALLTSTSALPHFLDYFAFLSC